MVQLASPRASRVVRPRWLDVRLGVGVLLVLISVVAGARVFASTGRLDRVYVAAHNLAAGEQLNSADVTVARVRLTGRSHLYVGAARPLPAGYVVVRPVAAGELLPYAAVRAGGAVGDFRQVAVPVQPGHLPDALGTGDRVDVYLSPRGSGGELQAPTLVLAGAAVQARSGGTQTLGATGSTVTVLLSVPTTQVAAVVRAVEGGVVDLVQDPGASGAVG